MTAGPMLLTDVHPALDLRLFQAVNQDGGPVLDAAMRALSSHAFGIAAALLVAAAIAARWGRASVRPLLALALAILVSDVVGSQVLKPLFGRMRPCYALAPGTFRWLVPAADSPSLPSLHASNAFAVALVASLAWRRLAAAVYVLALAVAASRVYLGVHWPSDVVAGAAWGSVAAGVAWWTAAAVPARWSQRAHPRAPP